MREATIVEIRDFFSMGSREISTDWKLLTEA